MRYVSFFFKCKDNDILLLYKMTIQSPCFNLGLVLFKQQSFVTRPSFSGEFTIIMTFAQWGQAESHCHALCFLSNNAAANTQL